MKTTIVSVVLVSCVVHARDARACATAPPVGQHVQIAGEEAIIVWDSAKRVQHFVRRAHFETEAEAFGFLVPVPANPTLSAIDNSIFDVFRRAIEPKRVTKEGWRPVVVSIFMTPFLFLSGSSRDMAGASRVAVLQEKRVGGFDAVVLAADDATSLAEWLERNGFASGADLTQWLEGYVSKRWKLVAFKIAKGKAARRALKTQAVRISFATDEPYYPYREPASQRDPTVDHVPRELRVFLASDISMEGRLAGRSWPAEVEYRAPSTRLAQTLSSSVAAMLPARPILHAFIDRRTPRPGVEDVFFSPAPDAPVVEPPPFVVDRRRPFWIPIDLLFIAAVIWWWRRRRRDRSST